MKLEILHGSEQYQAEHFASRLQPVVAPPAARGDQDGIPEPARSFSELYSNKHEKLLLRVDHIDRMDAIRRHFNKNRIHEAQRPVHTADIVTAALDFVFEHPIPFHRLADADSVRELIAEHVYRYVISRWRQWSERF